MLPGGSYSGVLTSDGRNHKRPSKRHGYSSSKPFSTPAVEGGDNMASNGFGSDGAERVANGLGSEGSGPKAAAVEANAATSARIAKREVSAHLA